MDDFNSFEGFNATDLNAGSNFSNIALNTEQATTIFVKPEQIPLNTNIFQLPEKLLRRPKLFQLTGEFDLWIAARKRKHGLKTDAPIRGKLLKLSTGVVVRCDPDSDNEECLGFDENNLCRTVPSVVSTKQLNPAVITQRSLSSDSGISPEKMINLNEDLSQSSSFYETQANDSSLIDFNDTNENTDQSIQGTDVSGMNIIANSTKIINETASIITGFDSGFAELESSIESQNDNDELLADMGIHDSEEINEPEVQICTLSPIPKESEQILGGESMFLYFLLSFGLIEMQCFYVVFFSDETIQHGEDEKQNEGIASEIVERVSKWHEMLHPILSECEKRSNFDIHALGTDIMNVFPNENHESQNDQGIEHLSTANEISFDDVMDGRDKTYTARYFLSLLLLTNNKNVYLDVKHPEQNGDVICSKDNIKIKMRSKARHLDEVNRIDQHLNESVIRVQSSSESFDAASIDSDGMDPPSSSRVIKAKKIAQKRKWNA